MRIFVIAEENPQFNHGKKIKFIDKNSSLDKREGSVSQNAVSLLEQVRQKIVLVRGCQVILDSDVAALYGVQTREINQAVRNNPEKFPPNYVIELNKEEKLEVIKFFDNLSNLKFSPSLPKAFTEKGLYMLATILKSPQATQTTIAIIETFANVRQLKRELRALHEETDAKKQQSKMQHFGEMLSNIVMPDLETSETESSMEINFLIGKIKHTVRRVKRHNDADYTEVE